MRLRRCKLSQASLLGACSVLARFAGCEQSRESQACFQVSHTCMHSCRAWNYSGVRKHRRKLLTPARMDTQTRATAVAGTCAYRRCVAVCGSLPCAYHYNHCLQLAVTVATFWLRSTVLRYSIVLIAVLEELEWGPGGAKRVGGV